MVEEQTETPGRTSDVGTVLRVRVYVSGSIWTKEDRRGVVARPASRNGVLELFKQFVEACDSCPGSRFSFEVERCRS